MHQFCENRGKSCKFRVNESVIKNFSGWKQIFFWNREGNLKYRRNASLALEDGRWTPLRVPASVVARQCSSSSSSMLSTPWSVQQSVFYENPFHRSDVEFLLLLLVSGDWFINLFTVHVSNMIHSGTWWRLGWDDDFQPEGRGIDSRSSRHVGTLGKFFTCSCLCASAWNSDTVSVL